MLCKVSADDILKYFTYFLENKPWHFMQIVSLGMKCQILFSRTKKKNKKKIISLLSAELARRTVSVYPLSTSHNYSTRHFDPFLIFVLFAFCIFHCKQDLTVHVNHLLGRGLTWNVKSNLHWKIIIIIKKNDNVVCCKFAWHFCVEVLRPSQPNGVMSSAVSLPNHTFTGQA